jgi:hypothetical protein
MEESREVFPQLSVWYQCETCTLQRIKSRSKWTRDRLIEAGVDLSDGVWAFVYGGKVREYKPDTETLSQALSLPLTEESDEPHDDCLAFFKRWGPLGLDKIIVSSFEPDSRGAGELVRLKEGEGVIPFERYWQFFHKPGTKTRTRRPVRVDDEFEGYLEYWPLVHPKLKALWWSVIEDPSITQLGKLFEENVKVNWVADDPNKPFENQRSIMEFRYPSLFGELVSLSLAKFQSLRLVQCPPPCNKYFWTSSKQGQYCGVPCRERYHRAKAEQNRISSPVEKKKNALRTRLVSKRRRKLLVDLDLDEQQIRSEINDVRNEKQLRALERKYRRVFADLPKGPRLTQLKGRPKK